MFGLSKKEFSGLLSVCTTVRFSGSLASNSKGSTKCVSLNNQPCQARPTLVGTSLNSDQTIFCPFSLQWQILGVRIVRGSPTKVTSINERWGWSDKNILT